MPSIIPVSSLILTTSTEGKNDYSYFTSEDTDAGRDELFSQDHIASKSDTSQTQAYHALKDKREY